MEKYNHIAGIAFTAWSGLYIVEIEYGINDLIKFQYGYTGADKMQYKPLQTRKIEYITSYSDDCEQSAYFKYKGERIYLSDIIKF